MTLTLTQKAALETTLKLPIDFSDVIPETLAAMSLQELEQVQIPVGNKSVPLSRLFDVSGDISDLQLELHGDLSTVHYLGKNMSCGEFTAHGQVGNHAGSKMTGGKLTIHGTSGDWLGAEMSGGLIYVSGHAGNCVGGAYPGSLRGMNRGTIAIEGNCGNEAGLRMRRGTIAIAGDVGEMPGRSMRAGTLLALGNCGSYPGLGMKRGTLILFGHNPARLPSTFNFTCQSTPTILRLLFRELSMIGFSLSETLLAADVLQYSGDQNELGKGEVFVLASG